MSQNYLRQDGATGRAGTPLPAAIKTSLPQRRGLQHTPPSWIKGSPVFFITQCAAQRAISTLCNEETARSIFGAASNYHDRHRWYIHLLLLMPDHLHALISFPKIESMSQVIRSWKHYLSKQHGLKWQRDYFDHRIRDHAGLQEKGAYIRANPVRAGFVANPGQWRFVWAPGR